MEQQRLQPIIDRRQVGFEFINGVPTPRFVGYIIGHGQQLAARRLAEKVNANARRNAALNAMPAGGSRQVLRQQARAAEKAKARLAREDAARAARKARKSA